MSSSSKDRDVLIILKVKTAHLLSTLRRPEEWQGRFLHDKLEIKDIHVHVCRDEGK